MNCVYCAVAEGRSEAHILLQDELTVCFLDPFPNAPGHAVVIPKTHVADLFSCDEATWLAVCATARTVSQLLNTELGTDSVNLFHGSGAQAQQHVPHLAIHIIPRKEGDGLDHLAAVTNAHSNHPRHEHR